MATASLRGKSVYPPTDTKVDSAETVGREVDGGRWETGGGERERLGGRRLFNADDV